ncbi:hypothetical protein LIER_03233 [Lithospermum erythrorhizon]|uniref:Uncharacterized protein n=1 Tax=Lithospermum erythrorhizon TaxID=34254 RepID=A0AAV3NU24_LITER
MESINVKVIDEDSHADEEDQPDILPTVIDNQADKTDIEQTVNPPVNDIGHLDEGMTTRKKDTVDYRKMIGLHGETCFIFKEEPKDVKAFMLDKLLCSMNTESMLYRPDLLDILKKKEIVDYDDPNSGHDDQIHPDISAIGAKDNVHVPPIVDDTGKTRNPSSDNIEMGDSTETLLSTIEGSKGVEKHSEGVAVDAQHPDIENVCGEKMDVPGEMSGGVDGVNPRVKDTFDEIIYKSTKTHSFGDPIVAEILVGMKGGKPATVSGGRIKRRLRKESVPVRHVNWDSSIENPTIEDAVVNSPMENQDDDDIVVVLYTTNKSKRRTTLMFLPWKRRELY